MKVQLFSVFTLPTEIDTASAYDVMSEEISKKSATNRPSAVQGNGNSDSVLYAILQVEMGTASGSSTGKQEQDAFLFPENLFNEETGKCADYDRPSGISLILDC